MTCNCSASVTVLKGRVLFFLWVSVLEFYLAQFLCYGEQRCLNLQYYLSQFNLMLYYFVSAL